MTIFSSLRSISAPAARCVLNRGRDVGSSKNISGVIQQSVRWSGDHREMNIMASRWSYRKNWDELSWYFFGPLIPIGIFIHLVNIYVGPAELAEIPEGYEPENYEYYSHPITRWIVKNVLDHPQKQYERGMAHLQQEWEKQEMKKLELKIHSLMSYRGDYKGWYYIPMDTVKYAERKIYLKENKEVDSTDIDVT